MTFFKHLGKSFEECGCINYDYTIDTCERKHLECVVLEAAELLEKNDWSNGSFLSWLSERNLRLAKKFNYFFVKHTDGRSNWVKDNKTRDEAELELTRFYQKWIAELLRESVK